MSVPPAVGCPTCGAVLTANDETCYRCERAFAPGELWERYYRLKQR